MAQKEFSEIPHGFFYCLVTLFTPTTSSTCTRCYSYPSSYSSTTSVVQSAGKHAIGIRLLSETWRVVLASALMAWRECDTYMGKADFARTFFTLSLMLSTWNKELMRIEWISVFGLFFFRSPWCNLSLTLCCENALMYCRG